MMEQSNRVPTNFCDNFDHQIEETTARVDIENENDDNFDSIRTETFLQPRKTFKEILEILRSRTEMKQIFLKYKCLVFSSLIAVIGLIVSLRMVKILHLILNCFKSILKFSCIFSI